MNRAFLLLSLLIFPHLLRASEAADSTASATPSSRLPNLMVSYGALNFIGDVGYSGLSEPLLNHTGVQVAAQFSKKSRLSPVVYYLHGVVGANEKNTSRTLNFRTPFNAFGAQLYLHLVGQERHRVLVPFVTVGVEYISFTPKGDLTDAEGVPYYYWSDGTIRNIDENAPNASQAQLIHRDYTYETDLRQANLDGTGSYSKGTFAVPAGVGVRMNLSGRCSFYLSTVMHFTFTDYLDNITADGTGQRHGNSGNDRFLYTSAGLAYDLAAPRETPLKKKYKNKDYKNIDFNALAKEDQDKDGVSDLDDESPDTPPNVAVDSKGRPIDSDGDGVPDYRDKEMNSAKGALVNEEGVTMTDALIEEKFRQDSIAALPAVREYVRRVDDEEFTKGKGIPEEYKKVDVDNNGVISAKEIGDAIDEFLAGKSSYDTDAFYRLIDFYFSQ